MKWFLLLILFFILKDCTAQTADFLVFKKKNKTIARYFVGSDITFTATSGAYIDAKIIAIKNDSVFFAPVYCTAGAYTAWRICAGHYLQLFVSIQLQRH